MDKKAAMVALGCRVNQSEGEGLLACFTNVGYEIVPFQEKADVYIIHTCTVTSKADSKSRQLIRKAKKNNKDSIIVVTGCYAQTAPGELLGMAEVDLVLGMKDRNQVVTLVKGLESGEKKAVVANVFKERDFEGLPFVSTEKTRAFIKIEEGCESFCTYCIIPIARGPIRSRQESDILNEVEKLSNMGYQEVVLTGIHTGAYGKDFKNSTTLATLVKKIIEIDGIKRIRFGSLDPNEISDEFLAVFADKKVMPHLHLSLQSGDDTILKLMKRPYDSSLYEAVALKIRAIKEDVSLTTDVMVGFPYETNFEHENSMGFILKTALDNLHIFKYSKRKGTKAAAFPEQVEETVKNKRATEMKALKNKLHSLFLEQMVGKTLLVLVEENKENLAIGYSENYLRVSFASQSSEVNKIVSIKITGVSGDCLIAIEDINPVAPIHCLIIPKKHAATVAEMDGD